MTTQQHDTQRTPPLRQPVGAGRRSRLPEPTPGLSSEHAAVLELQRLAGNQAVQRQIGAESSRATGTDPGRGSPDPGARSVERTSSGRPSLSWIAPSDCFELHLDGQARSLDRTHATAYVRRIMHTLGQRLMDAYSNMSEYNDQIRLGHRGRLQAGRGLQAAQTEADEGNSVSEFFHMLVSVVSEHAGGTEMPGPGIFQEAQDQFDLVTRSVRSGDLVTAFEAAEAFEQPFNQAVGEWRQFVTAAGEGAETTAGRLETVRDVSFAVVASAATGGLADAMAGATVAGMTISEGTAGVLAATATGAGSAAVGAGSRELGEFVDSGDTEIDWAQGAEEILAGAASGAFSGAVGNWIKGALASRLFTARWFQMAILRARMATDPQNPLVRGGVVAIDNYLSQHGSELIATSVTTVFTAAADAARELRDRPDVSLDEYLNSVWSKLRSAGYAEIVSRLLPGS